VLVDVGRRLAGRVDDDVAARLLLEHHRGAVDVQHVADARQQLAQQVVQRQGGERRVGDGADRALALGGRLGLRAGGLLAHELLPRGLCAALRSRMSCTWTSSARSEPSSSRATEKLSSASICSPPAEVRRFSTS
jgi:hypothetical protein